jgi:hypothetical protein
MHRQIGGAIGRVVRHGVSLDAAPSAAGVRVPVGVDVAKCAPDAGVAMEVDMAAIDVDLVGVDTNIRVRKRARQVSVLVRMRVRVRGGGGITVRIGVYGVGVVVVRGPVGVGNVSVILVRGIGVIAMPGVQMIRVGHIQVVMVRRGLGLVVVIAMLHIPVVPVRRLLRRGIQVARTGKVGVIGVGGCVGVVSMERIIEVIGMPGVGVISKREIAVRVGVIAMVAVAVAMTIEMCHGIRMVAVGRRIRVGDVCVRRRIRMRCVTMVGVVRVWRDRGIEVDVQVFRDTVPMR